MTYYNTVMLGSRYIEERMIIDPGYCYSTSILLSTPSAPRWSHQSLYLTLPGQVLKVLKEDMDRAKH